MGTCAKRKTTRRWGVKRADGTAVPSATIERPVARRAGGIVCTTIERPGPEACPATRRLRWAVSSGLRPCGDRPRRAEVDCGECRPCLSNRLTHLPWQQPTPRLLPAGCRLTAGNTGLASATHSLTCRGNGQHQGSFPLGGSCPEGAEGRFPKTSRFACTEYAPAAACCRNHSKAQFKPSSSHLPRKASNGRIPLRPSRNRPPINRQAGSSRTNGADPADRHANRPARRFGVRSVPLRARFFITPPPCARKAGATAGFQRRRREARALWAQRRRR